MLVTGCFTGSFLAGRACTEDSACGPELRCEQGFCGGSGSGSSSATSGASDVGPPTSGAVTSTTAPATTTGTGEASDAGGTSTTTAATSSSGADSTTQGPDPCADSTCKQIDLLFVIDDSPSIAQWQQQLLQALLSLNLGPVGDLVKDSCDAHVGVVTTGELYAHNPPACQGSGALVRVGVGGDDCVEGRPYATQADDIGAAMACMVLVGSDGPSDERAVQSLLDALSEPLNEPGGCNDGFFRPDSLLVVVLISDEDDDADDGELPDQQTAGAPQEWFDQIVAFKGSAERVVFTALLGPTTEPSPCPWTPGGADGTGAEPPLRLLPFVELFPRRATASICQDDYSGFIQGPLYSQIVAACEAHAAGG